MKSLYSAFLFFALALFTLTSCEKEEPDLRVPAKAQIIFNDDIDKITASYLSNSSVVLKISASNATSVRVTSLYTANKAPKSQDLGTQSLSDGTTTFNILATSLRNTADGPLIAEGSTQNTYTLKVDAIMADGSFETRYFAAVVARPK